MKPIALILAAALCSAATAQTAAPTKPSAPTKPTARPAKPASKPVPKAVVEPPPPAADADQKSAASMAHLGDYACEFDQTVQVVPNPQHEGYLDVKHKAQSWIMKPVLSSTGA